MSQPPTNNPLQGITLQALLTELVALHGWDGLARMVDIRCFKNAPSIKSSLTFLRKTPWARTRVEQIYLDRDHASTGAPGNPERPVR